MTDLKNEAAALGEKIQNSAEFIAFQQAKAQHDSDPELQTMIGEFNLKRMSLMQEDEKGEDADQEKMDALEADMQEIYNNVMNQKSMVAFAEAKENLEKLLNDIYGVINYYVTGEEPGCGGDCGSCGCGGDCGSCH